MRSSAWDSREPDGRRGRVDAGFNGMVAFDVFPLAPLVLSAAVDLGMLGQAFALRARGTLGVILTRVELFGGYDVMALDEPRLPRPRGRAAGVDLVPRVGGSDPSGRREPEPAPKATVSAPRRGAAPVLGCRADRRAYGAGRARPPAAARPLVQGFGLGLPYQGFGLGLLLRR